MGEQIGIRLNRRFAACKFPSESIRKNQLLRPRRIKKNLNQNLKPKAIFMTVGLIIFLISALVYYLIPPPDPYGMFNPVHDPAVLLFIIFLEIIMLGAGWGIYSEIREYDKTKTS